VTEFFASVLYGPVIAIHMKLANKFWYGLSRTIYHADTGNFTEFAGVMFRSLFLTKAGRLYPRLQLRQTEIKRDTIHHFHPGTQCTILLDRLPA
jgi:hypothetical protein